MSAVPSAAEIAVDVRAGRLSAERSVAQAIERMDAVRDLNAVTHIHAARATAQAKAVDRQVAAGEDPGPLAGVPFAAKNLFDVAGLVTRVGSRAGEAKPPAAQDAFAIRALEAAGAILVASTSMDELAYGFSGENAHDGDTCNPRDRALSAGGSSSGSAALVAVGAVPLALGTDTNGSIRVPAALSGVAGLKPTYGRLSRSGVAPFVHSLDHVGPLAAHVGDLALAYDALQGRDDGDPVQAVRPAEPVHAGLDAGTPIQAKRLGGYFEAPLHSDVEAAFEDAAAVLQAGRTVTLSHAEAARAASFVITTAEGGQQHLPGLIAHPERFGPLVRNRLRAGALVPAAWTARAQKLRRMVSDELTTLMMDADILVAPATPTVAFPLGVADWDVAGVSLPIRLGIGMFTQALTLTGVPIAVVTRPGAASGLPVGVQVIGRPFEEATVLRAALRLEKAGFHMAPQALEPAHA